MSKSSANKFINRELSWLEFNQRVLDEARDDSIPLLERLKFLAITGSNLDEFFMVRVGSLKLLSAQRSTKKDPAGLTPDQQLKRIEKRVRCMLADQYACFNEELESALADEGIRRVAGDQLTERQSKDLRDIFDSEVFSVLTPMAVTSVDDFPLLVDQRLNVCVRLAPAARDDEQDDAPPRFAVIPLGQSPRRFITVSSEGGYCYTLLEDAVKLFADWFFPGERIEECVPFRISRNADMAVREDLASDLLIGMEDVLDQRKQSGCVRLEIVDSASELLQEFLRETLQINKPDVYAVPGPLDLSAFMQLADLQGFDELKYESWPPVPPPDIDLSGSMFDVIAGRDVLLYHPYESFEPVVQLIEQAASDPDVLAIKQVLYRTSRKSPIIAALATAAQQGKYVTAVIELKARFDEARNIQWAKNLERAGVQVIYGVKGLKTHAKVCLIVRREPHGIQRYVHYGTGNYNEATARIYSDVSYLTSDEELGADATTFFNSVTGYSQPQGFRKIEAAPFGLRERLLEMIDAETQRRQHGQKAHIAAKINSLVDPEIIKALYKASQAGVQVKLNIRGICCLRPGVEGLSENISVVSIVDRYLEHARILYFYHGGDERVFISSADWMQRNLDKRCELLIPVEDVPSQQRLIDILEAYFKDTVKASQLLPDGTYERIRPRGRRKTFRSQEDLYQRACDAVKLAEQSKRTVFEPHRPDSEAKDAS